MKQSSNLGLALYDKTDLMNITGLENSLNHNMELIDSEISQLSANNDPRNWGIGIVLANTPGSVITDFDEILPTGFYYVQTGSLNGPINGALYAVVINRSYDNVFVFAEDPDGVISRRKYNGSWGVWEYVNPRMQLGVEYRTTERYLDKPVYTTAVDLGNAVSDGDITVRNWLPNAIKILRAMGSIALSNAWSEGAGMSIIPSYPYGLTSSNPTWDVYIKEADNEKIVAYTGASQVGRKVIVTAWYTKD